MSVSDGLPEFLQSSCLGLAVYKKIFENIRATTWLAKELSRLWLEVSGDSWWQRAFMALGLCRELSTSTLGEIHAKLNVPNQPFAVAGFPITSANPSPKKQKGVAQKVPQSTQSARPAPFGQPVPEEPIFKAARKEASNRKSKFGNSQDPQDVPTFGDEELDQRASRKQRREQERKADNNLEIDAEAEEMV